MTGVYISDEHQNISIHPTPRSKKTISRKRANRIVNLQARAEINRLRSSSPNNPTFHGGGRHAGVPVR